MSQKNIAGEQKLKLALKRELLVTWWRGWIVLIACYLVLGLAWEWTQAHQWLIQTTLLWCLVFRLTSGRIGLNRANPEASLYIHLGLANRLTFIRGGLIAMTGGFILLQTPPGLLAWVPGIFYTIAAIIDRLDGYFARKTKQQSLLGIELDTLFDALGLAIAPILAVWYGQIHWSYLAVSSAYYLFRWGLYYRTRNGLPVVALRPGIFRRSIAGYQMGFIAVVLWPLFQPPLTTIAGIAFMLPLLLGFVIDWLIVSARIDLGSRNIINKCNKLKSIRHSVFQPSLRILVVVFLYLALDPSDYSFISGNQTELSSAILVYGSALAASLILLGIAGRLAALALVLLLGWYYLYSPLGVVDVILIFSVIWVMSLGTGRFSLWQRDEDWVNRYDGA